MKSCLLAFVAVSLLTACSAKPMTPGAEKVLLSNDKPSGECEFLGEVVGGQGNWWTDDITSTKNVVEGSRNDMRNKAYALGANYVHIQQIAQDTSYLGGGKMGVSGNAYRCKTL